MFTSEFFIGVLIGFVLGRLLNGIICNGRLNNTANVLAKILDVSSSDESVLCSAILSKTNISNDEATRILQGMKWIGLFSNTPVHLRGTLLDTLCATLEEKMQYGPGERDMVILQHKFGIEWKDGTKETRTSTLLEFGDPNGSSAMARTVGTPCGIATQLVLDGVLNQKGVVAPYSEDVNKPIMEALEKEGIKCVEEIL